MVFINGLAIEKIPMWMSKKTLSFDYESINAVT